MRARERRGGAVNDQTGLDIWLKFSVLKRPTSRTSPCRIPAHFLDVGFHVGFDKYRADPLSISSFKSMTWRNLMAEGAGFEPAGGC